MPKSKMSGGEKAVEPDVKIEVISTVLISNKKDKQKRKDKTKVDKKGSVVQNNEAFNKAFDLIKTAE